MAAQSSASIFIVNADEQPLVGSIVAIVCLWMGLPPPIKSGARILKSAAFQSPSLTSKTALRAYSMLLVIRECKSGSLELHVSILNMDLSTATIKCSVQGTVAAVCTGGGDIPAEESGAPAEAVAVTTTLSSDEITFTEIPIIGAAATLPTEGSATATSTKSPTTQSSTAGGSASSQTGSTSSQSSPSSGQADSTGTTGSATTLDRSSMIALVGAAALAAVLL
ncbi:MAG: hypothetical protein Q9169_005166 [Polycauliona sp. 2 TL-2023]